MKFSRLRALGWNVPVSKSQRVAESHAPVEVNKTPTLIHRDLGMSYFHMINEELNEYRESVQNEDLNKEDRLIAIADALIDMLYLIFGAISAYGFKMIAKRLFLEVHRSNKTKIKDGNVVVNTDGKVMKRKEDYEAPYLSKIIFED